MEQIDLPQQFETWASPHIYLLRDDGRIVDSIFEMQYILHNIYLRYDSRSKIRYLYIRNLPHFQWRNLDVLNVLFLNDIAKLALAQISNTSIWRLWTCFAHSALTSTNRISTLLQRDMNLSTHSSLCYQSLIGSICRILIFASIYFPVYIARINTMLVFWQLSL